MALDNDEIPYMLSRPPALRSWGLDARAIDQILVLDDVASEARAIVADLQSSPQGERVTVDARPETQSNTADMATYIQLHNADDDQPIGEITDDELQFLFDQLERESDTDDDFFIDASTIEMLEDAKAPAHLVEMLKKAVGSSEGVEVRWKRDEST